MARWKFGRAKIVSGKSVYLCGLVPVIFRALLIFVTAGCLTSYRTKESPVAAPKPDPVRITQFYATELKAPKGEPVNLCYGVENDSVVRLAPPVEQLHPSLSRCFPVTQTQTITYTLIAEDKQGGTASQSITLPTTGPLPKFIDLVVNSH
jgi:hypothetical protein